MELNACADDDYRSADKELNKVYHALLNEEADDPAFIAKLRTAQKAWLAFRDAELEAEFACAEEDPRHCWGSMLPMCKSTFLAKLTRERTRRLKTLLGEGRGC